MREWFIGAALLGVIVAVVAALVAFLMAAGILSDPNNPTPTLSFDDAPVSGAYGYIGTDGEEEIAVSCNGEIAKRGDELTREDLLAIINVLIHPEDFEYFESLCPAPPPIQ